MPSKSQIALALVNSVRSVARRGGIGFDNGDIRVRVDLIKEASAIILVENAREAPWLLLERLYVLNLND